MGWRLSTFFWKKRMGRMKLSKRCCWLAQHHYPFQITYMPFPQEKIVNSNNLSGEPRCFRRIWRICILQVSPPSSMVLRNQGGLYDGRILPHKLLACDQGRLVDVVPTSSQSWCNQKSSKNPTTHKPWGGIRMANPTRMTLWSVNLVFVMPLDLGGHDMNRSACIVCRDVG